MDHYAQVESGPFGCTFIVATAPTSVTGAVDFTDDNSEAFDGERHTFRFENADVATKFAELNADRQWDPTSPKVQTAWGSRWVVIIAIVLFALYQIVRETFR